MGNQELKVIPDQEHQESHSHHLIATSPDALTTGIIGISETSDFKMALYILLSALECDVIQPVVVVNGIREELYEIYLSE